MKPLNKLLFWIVGIFIIGTMLLTAFSRRISGKVIDASTGAPINEAIILAQWTVTHGIGDHSHTVSKITEVLTNQNGDFFIWGPLNPFANSPELIVFKEGYVAWRNDYIFPAWERRDSDGGGKIILSPFKDEYSYFKYSSFLSLGVMEQTPKLREIIHKVNQEGERRTRIQIPLDFSGMVVDAATGAPIEGALLMAIGSGLGYTSKVNTVVEGISDKNGNVRITGEFPMLENPPNVLVYKKGYLVQSSWRSMANIYKQLTEFKWQNGFVFKLNKWGDRWTPTKPIEDHFDFINNIGARYAAQEGKPFLLKSILWEKKN